MLVIGLTGSIAMGKSRTADLFREAGALVHDADAVVHALYQGAAVASIEAAFPGTTAFGAVDRAALRRVALGDGAALARLERIVHPLVQVARDAFLTKAATGAERTVVLDLPLLFETRAERYVDVTVVVTAPESVQKARVMARPGMTEERFGAIMARQMPDSEKRRRAHFLIDTGRGFASARAQIGGVLRAVAAIPGGAFASCARQSNPDA